MQSLRKRMGVLFQQGALFTDLNVFENVAFPLREHTRLSEAELTERVLDKLDAVGLRAAAHLKVAEVSGGMARRVALARAVVLEPELILYDEPFAGLDPISMGITARLIRDLADRLGCASVLITHDVQESFAIADQVYLVGQGNSRPPAPADPVAIAGPLRAAIPQGRTRRPRRVPVPRNTGLQEMAGATTGAQGMSGKTNPISALGGWIRGQISGIGYFTRFFLGLLGRSGIAFSRPRLVSQQIHFIGNYSLLIIAVSGMFVGFVLGLQGYYTLNRYGSSEALGLLVALSLVRELGPVVTALLFAGRAGTSLTAEIGLMKAGEQLSAMEVMAVDPMRRVLVPRLWGGIIAMPILAAVFSMVGILGGWVVGVLMIGVDPGAFWSQMQNGVDVWNDVLNGVIKSLVFGVTVTLVSLYEGWQAKPTPEGVARATTRTVVVGSLAVLGLDFLLTALMFGN